MVAPTIQPHKGKTYWISCATLKRCLALVVKVTPKWLTVRPLRAVQTTAKHEDGRRLWAAGYGGEVAIPRAFPHTIERTTVDEVVETIAALANDQRLDAAEPGQPVKAVGRCDVDPNPQRRPSAVPQAITEGQKCGVCLMDTNPPKIQALDENGCCPVHGQQVAHISHAVPQ